MVDFGKSDKMIKISGKVDKSNTYNGYRGNIRSLLTEKLQKHFLIEEKN